MRPLLPFATALTIMVASTIPLTAVELPVQQDAYVTSAFPATNFGSAPTLNIDSASATFLNFDLTDVFANMSQSNLRKATLRLYVNKLTSPGQVQLQMAASTWNESTINANNQPWAFSPPLVFFPVTKANAWVSVDVTAFVQAFITAQSSNGFALGSAGGSFSFDSKENTATGHAPVLEIEYILSQPTGTGGFSVAFGPGALQSNPTGAGNSAFGWSALSLNGSGVANTAVGGVALSNNTSGNDNTAVGYNAAFSNVTGHYNSGFGVSSLYSNQSGSFNTAVGVTALSTTNANDNSALGYAALGNSQAGNGNTAVGKYALFGNNNSSLNTGSNNAGVGINALLNNTSGAKNVGVGANAMYANQGGNFNTSVGADSLLSNTSGNNNVATGASALKASVSGNNNTALGQGALSGLTSGDNNIAIGYAAATTLQNGSQNIYIGSDPPATTESGKIRIGSASQTATYISGITGAVAVGLPVLVQADGKLGVAPSSARYKQEIEALPDLSDALMQLRPVMYRYIAEAARGNQQLEYGLIAEEVAKVLPNLVFYDQQGRPDAVLYQKLNALLLDQVQRQQRRVAELESRLEALEGALQRK